ncbi:hypothetical protein [Thermopirellula anaerolimosa]
MADMTDWRLQGQERFLKGVSLLRRTYRKYREGWEHDHCEFCGAKFSEQGEGVNVGYTTIDRYHWICEECYKDFKDMFQWTLVDEPCDPKRRA